MSKQESSEEQTNEEGGGGEHDGDPCAICGKKRARFVFQRAVEVFDLIGEEYVRNMWGVENEERLCSECASERSGRTLGDDDDDYEWFYCEEGEDGDDDDLVAAVSAAVVVGADGQIDWDASRAAFDELAKSADGEQEPGDG